jgi:hypothetical protein
MVAYERPGKKLGKTISYYDPAVNITYIFEVPRKAVGAKDIALAVNHSFDAWGNPLIAFEYGKGWSLIAKVKDKSRIGIIEDFPQFDAWYKMDEIFGVPSGKRVSRFSPQARFLVRTAEPFVGFAVRGFDSFDFFGSPRTVDLSVKLHEKREAFGIKLKISPPNIIDALHHILFGKPLPSSQKPEILEKLEADERKM